MSWQDLARWWREELTEDPSYETDVSAIVANLSNPSPDSVVLDVGCGEGRVMAWLTRVGSRPIGVDLSVDLLTSACAFGPVVRAMLPTLAWARTACVDHAIVSLVLEHVEDEEVFFSELGRVVRSGGQLVLVINHPIFTAPESAPIQEDDEVLWRPGRYFDRGFTDERAGEGTIRFHHRTMAELLNAASAGGWDLHRMVESGATDTQIGRNPALADQRHIPRLLGLAWTRRPT